MDQAQAAARTRTARGGAGSALVVLVEDDAGDLDVLDPGDGAIDPSVLTGARLDELVLGQDLSALRAARRHARDRHEQDACQVRLATGGDPTQWFEVRYLPDVPVGGMLVLLRDVAQERELAAEAAVLRRITELANSATDAGEAVRTAVDDLRSTLGWRAGRVLRMVADTLADAGGWSVADGAESLPEQVAAAAPNGTPVAALAAERGVPVSTGTADEPVPSALQDLGVATVVAVPVVADGDVAQVLEFHLGTDTSIDEDQHSLLAEVGRQLGWVVVRQRSLEELEESHAELARSNAELERFAYVASHDLQEPLRKIIGFSELLQDHHEPLDEDEAEYRRYVVESARRLQRLIKDLLAYSRAGRRELASEPVDLDAVVEGVLEDLALTLEEEDATTHVGELPTVSGDEGQLREVFQNLVSNALKYRSEERAPALLIQQETIEDADDDLVHVVVADNGIGIAPDQREAVFEVFRRLHPAHAYSGTGLGLALVQRIVTRHGGTVTITDSPLGDGIAVRVGLPRHQEKP